MRLLRHGVVAALGLLLLLNFALVRGDDLPEQSAHAFAVEQKLKSIVVSIDFAHASLDDSVRALASMSKKLDPEHKGINFFVQPRASETTQPITLKLDKVPLDAALHYVCELSNARYKINDYTVVIMPPSESANYLVKRTFHVDPSFVESAANAGVIPALKTP
jgi:hypothetical protein